MVDTIPRPDASLPEFLAARARHASDDRLAAYAIGGAVGGIVTAYWGGPGWHILLAVHVCCFAFGLWGVADRDLSERANAGRVSQRALAAIRVIAASIGFIAAAFLMMSLLGTALGKIIS